MNVDPRPIPSSIGRPLDPSWPTNRAVLILLPIGALVAMAVEYLVRPGSMTGILFRGVAGAAVVLGAWALARELVPDDQRAAFIALTAAFGTFLTMPGQSLLVLFTGLLLARIVNRTVGPPPRATDSLVVAALAGVASYATGSPAISLVAAATFALDTVLPGGQSRQWWFSVTCLVMAAAQHFQMPPWTSEGSPTRELPAGTWLVLTFAVTGVYLIALARTNRVEARADLTGEPLSPRRVQAGMLVVLTLGLSPLMNGGPDPSAVGLIWATATGIGISTLLPRAAGTS